MSETLSPNARALEQSERNVAKAFKRCEKSCLACIKKNTDLKPMPEQFAPYVNQSSNVFTENTYAKLKVLGNASSGWTIFDGSGLSLGDIFPKAFYNEDHWSETHEANPVPNDSILMFGTTDDKIKKQGGRKYFFAVTHSGYTYTSQGAQPCFNTCCKFSAMKKGNSPWYHLMKDIETRKRIVTSRDPNIRKQIHVHSRSELNDLAYDAFRNNKTLVEQYRS